jgi:hypothetical protein
MFARPRKRTEAGDVEQARIWVPRSAALAAFALYALAAPSGLYWLDSGELSASGLGLGVAHPTGFPLYMVLVKLASLVPLGELAFRVNLLSAVCAALAVLWVAQLVLAVCKDDAAAIAGAAAASLTLALSLTFFRQATVAEVYAPTAAALVYALRALVRVVNGGGARDGLVLAVVCGLGLATHSTFGLIGAPVAVLLVVRLYRGARWTLAMPMVTVLVAGGLFLYLPVRAAAPPQPSIQWERTDTSGGLAAHLSGARIRAAFADDMRSTQTSVWSTNAARFFTDAAEQLLFALLAALAGLVWLLRQRRTRWIGGTLAFIAVADAGYSFWLNPMGQADLQNGVPFMLVACVAAGAGVAVFGRVLGRAAPFAAGATAVVLAVSVASVSAGQVWAARTGDLPRGWAEAGLDATPSRGIAMVENDSTASAMIFSSAIEHARPDVSVIVKQRSVEGWRTRRILSRVDPRAALFGGRPLTWELGLLPPPAGYRLEIGMPLARLVPATESASGSVVPGELDAVARRLIQLFDHRSAADPAATLTLAQALNVIGRVALERGDNPTAARAYDAALAVYPRFARAWVNRGAVAAARGDFTAAIADTEQALRLAPNHEVGLVNLSRYYIRLDRDGDATRVVARLRDAHPRNASGLALAGLIAARAGKLDEARRLVEKALAIDRSNVDAVGLARQLGRHD